MKQLKVTLKRSVVDTKESHKRTVRALGLRKTGRSRRFDDTPQLRGMIKKVSYLLKVEEV
jgi:large subunit ribosomal protein L30